VLTLYNREGLSLEVDPRPARPGDVPRIISLMRKQHGESYMPSFYREEWVREKMEQGLIRFSVAELPDGSIAGMIGADREGIFPGSLILILLVVDRSLRGFGLGKLLYGSILETVSRDPCTCIYGHCLTLDTISQSFHAANGFKMTGLIIDRYRFDAASPYLAGMALPAKYSALVACLPRDKRDAGVLYVPQAYVPFVKEVYDSLGAACAIAPGLPASSGSDPASFPAEGEGIFSSVQNDIHRYCEMVVSRTGRGLREKLGGLIDSYEGLEGQTFNLFVSMNDPGCPGLCAFLEKRGFFFTGVQPLSGLNEYLIYHYSPGLPVSFDRIAVVPGFAGPFDWIRSLYAQSPGRI
jgi:GNAT superfamily N-acetyltransferase